MNWLEQVWRWMLSDPRNILLILLALIALVAIGRCRKSGWSLETLRKFLGADLIRLAEEREKSMCAAIEKRRQEIEGLRVQMRKQETALGADEHDLAAFRKARNCAGLLAEG